MQESVHEVVAEYRFVACSLAYLEALVGLVEQRVAAEGIGCSFGLGTDLAVVVEVGCLEAGCFVVGCLRQCFEECPLEYPEAFLVAACRVVVGRLHQIQLRNHARQ